MENINFRGIPTSLFLNGPKLGIVTDPQSAGSVSGVATFTGIATATFDDANFSLDGGSIAFKWYYNGSQILDTSEDSNSNASIVGFSSATGTGSTITINGLTAGDTGKEVYFTADYIPSAYSQPAGSAVTAGTARSTGNAYNEPIQSGIATITLSPTIEITKQPTDVTIGETFEASFSVAAQKTPGGGAVSSYQWQLDGNDLSDGTTTTTVTDSTTGQIQVTDNLGGSATIDFSQISSYDNFVTYRTYTLVANADITTKIFATGAGGGASDSRSVAGGNGGEVNGEFTFVKDQVYKLIIGEGGDPGTIRRQSFTQGGQGGGGYGGGGNGGGYTGLFLGPTVTHSQAILIAGAGGGGSNDPARGGDGGGLTGGNAGNAPSRGGEGGTQSAGGAGAGTGSAGGALFGGPGASGGGGGYYGGGGGNSYPSCCADGAGGGGSSYFNPALITNGSTTAGAGGAGGNNRDGRTVIRTAYNGRPEAGAPTYESVGGDGSFRIELASIKKTVTTTVSGATTQNLKITSDGTGSGVIRCKVTATDVQVSPVYSKSVSYYVIAKRNLIKIEQYDYANATATLSESNLSDGGLSMDYSTHPGNAVCLYAAEQDVEVEVDMYGGKGSDVGEYQGGEGGYSKISFTMKKDEEYILTGLFDSVNAPFLYRKGTLIACVGGGGNAGSFGRGGAGGGVKTSGENAPGIGGGLGGVRYLPGNLPSENGIFGSLTTLTPVTPDTKATGVDGGRTIPCPRGDYWRNQGKAPCEDLGNIKFRTPDGTEISNTATITRGYKSGYNIIQTKGAQNGFRGQGGDGGSGSTGGQGGTSREGGGGGSGYHDGSITEITTQLGGSTGPARINIKLSTGNYYIDSEGRILIMSWSPNQPSDAIPYRALQKTTGIVNPTDFGNCIDDARWQRFLDLARDGTQNYRLTATGWNNPQYLTNATDFNIHKMLNANVVPLRDSLTAYVQESANSNRYSLAWDEDSGTSASGGDYSLLWHLHSTYTGDPNYGFGYYGHSQNSFFTETKYYIKSANWWILPPGVPDFPKP